jgi:hypothetical protein
MRRKGRMGARMQGWQTVLSVEAPPARIVTEERGTTEEGGRRTRSAWRLKRRGDDLSEARESIEWLRPRTRRDCRDGIRPCPFLSCQHHTLHSLVIPPDGSAPRLDLALIANLDETNSCILDRTEALF